MSVTAPAVWQKLSSSLAKMPFFCLFYRVLGSISVQSIQIKPVFFLSYGVPSKP